MEAPSFTGGSASAEISNRFVRFYVEHVGRGPTKVRTYISDDVVLCVMRDAATVAERTLREAGSGETARHVRRLIRRRHAEELASIVEDVLDKRVLATLGDFDPETDIVVLVFPLEHVEGAQS